MRGFRTAVALLVAGSAVAGAVAAVTLTGSRGSFDDVVIVLAVVLIQVRRGLSRISEGLATLGSALETVEAEHLRPLEPAVKAINAQFDTILGALPGIGRKAAIVAATRPR